MRRKTILENMSWREEGEKMNLGVNEKDRKTSMLRRVEVVIF